MLLSKKTRQEYLQALGFYNGKIDGKEGKLTKEAYIKLQNKYFIRKKDKDGKYGKNTDILLRNAYNVYLYSHNFKLEEFKCKCKGKYCTGYPAIISTYLLKNIQNIRNKYGATKIESGIRCQKHNDAQKGSVKKSRHISGKAIDFTNAETKTLEKRKEQMEYWWKLSKPNYTYCNGWYIQGKKQGKKTASNMGRSIHADVK